MPVARFQLPDGRIARFEVPEGTTPEQAQQAIRSHLAGAPTAAAPSKPFGEQLNDFISDVPRQVGLTARYGLEGIGDIADLVASPMRGALNLLPGVDIKPGVGRTAADMASLPQPRTADERVVADATRLLAGAGVPIGAGAALAKNATGTTKGVASMFASNRGQQLVSAGAAGAAGGYTRETGGNEGAQLVASLLAGIGAPMALNKAVSTGASVTQAARNAVAPRAVDPVRIDVTINTALQPSGISLAQLPAEVAAGVRADVANALQVGDNLSPDAVRRLADFRLTGTTPTAASLTLDPAIVTQQRNLAKLGANSKDPAAQQLAQVQNANNRTLTANLNTLGGGTADDAIAGGSKVMDALARRDARARELIGERYNAARATNGRSAALDPYAFSQRANNMLDEALLGGKLPGDVRNLLNAAAKGDMPLTVDVAEQFKTRIGDLQRSTLDMAERKALGMVRSALDDAPLLPGQQIGQESIDAFSRARALNRGWMSIVEKTPALQAVRDGIEPDKFVQQFIIGGGNKSNVMDVAMLKNSIRSSPEAMTAVKEQITSFLKQRALNGATDEVGNFSQSGYNKALEAIGDRKLKLFFKPEEIAQLKAIGRVASYEQVQPVGSAVNNSNTAGAGLSALLDRVGGSALLSKVPLGRLVQEPIQNIALGMQSQRALSVPNALGLGAPAPMLSAPPSRQMLVSPAALLGLEDEETRRKRELGLLLP